MNRLKDLRLLNGWNMKQAAEKIGMPYTSYVSYEKEGREMNSEILIKFESHHRHHFEGETILPLFLCQNMDFI